MFDFKQTLGGPIKYRTLYWSSKFAQLKYTFDSKVYNLLSFKASSPFFSVCTVWLYTLSQCIAEQNQLGLHNILHCWSYTLGFAENLNLPQSKDLDTQIHTIH